MSTSVPSEQAIAHNERGIAAAQAGRRAEALAEFERAVALNPASASLHSNLGNALAAVERHEEAVACYRRALAIDSTVAAVHGSLGTALRTLGRIEASRAAFEAAIALKPRQPGFYHGLSQSIRFAPGDPHVAAMEGLVGDDSLDPHGRVFLHFALGKAYADIGRHADAFNHFCEANALRRGQFTYDEAGTLGFFERTARAFTPELMLVSAGGGDPSPLPIFIFGMPRSGSTLIEQVLASHPRVFGGGEINAFRGALLTVEGLASQEPRFPESIAAMDAERLRGIGGMCVQRLRGVAPTAERVTDKTLGNFLYAGLIHLALPNASLIHARRDPADTCFSCFSKFFASQMRYTYDLGELGRYYRGYAALMAHWRSVLPPGAMLEVQYEDLVSDFEAGARRIVAHCGLDWDDACLAFHTTERAVGTSSAMQVRQPVNRDSIGRWRAYEEYLQPLLRELEGRP